MKRESFTPLGLLKQFCAADYIERDREKALCCLSTDIHWFGTSDAEDVSDIREADEYIKKEISSSPAPYKIRFLQERETIVDEGVGAAALKMTIEAEGLAVISRITCTTKIEDGVPKICEMHTSIPEVSQEDDEYFPFEFAKEHDKEVVQEFLDTMIPGGILGIYLEQGFPLAMINHVMLSCLGYPNEEEYKKEIDGKIMNAVHPEDCLILNDALELRVGKGDELKTLLRIKKSDNSYFWADIKGIQGVDSQKREVLICLCLDAAETMQSGDLPEGSGVETCAQESSGKAEQETDDHGEKKGQDAGENKQRRQKSSKDWHYQPGKSIFAAVAAVSVLIIMVVIFTSYLLGKQWEAEKSSVRSASLASAKCVSNEINADREVILGTAALLGNQPGGETVRKILKKSTSAGFWEFIICYDDGTTYSSFDRTTDEAAEIIRSYQFSDSAGNIKTFAGDNGKKQMVFREDVTYGGEKKGVLYGTVDLSKYYFPEVMEFYGGQGFSYVIEAKSGEILIYKDQTMAQRGGRDLYSTLLEGERPERVQSLKKALLKGKTYSLTTVMQGKKTFMYFVPVSADSAMYLTAVIPYDVMKKESSGMIYLTAFFITVVLLTMVLIILFNNRVVKMKMQEREYRETLFRMLAENIDSVFLIFDSQSEKVEYVSENMDRILGIDHKQLMQESSRFEWPVENRKLIREFMKKEENFFIDFSYSNIKNQRKQLLRISGYVPEGSVWQKKWLLCIEDRTDAVLKEKRLEQAVKAADEANRAKSEFLANMSHDIRTPMNGIMGLTQLALMKDVGIGEMKKYMQKIAMSSTFLLTLINDILDMSKIESGKIELHPRPYSMEELCEYLESVILPLAQEKNIKFTRNVDLGIVVSVDRQRFNQILFNLLSNAVKYTEKDGQISLTIHSENKGKGLIHLSICVEDNGIGMTPEFQKKMFKPFTQEIRNITGLNGTGLGLAIVKKLTDLMDGRIRVESSVGKGSRFFLELDAQAAELERQNPVKTEDRNYRKRQKMPRILLCEDNMVNQEIMVGILEAIDMKPDPASNGKEGAEKYKSHEAGYYDAVLMDCRMPVMDGYETTRIIRASGRPDALVIPIIALTADAFEEDRRRCLEAGMNDFLTKPVEMKTLKELLRKYIPDLREEQ